MGKIFTPVSFTRVRKLEFPDLVNGVVDIVDGYNPETMHIADTYNLLLEAKPQLSSLVVINKKHPETKVLDSLRLRRKNILQSLVRQTKAKVTANLDSQKTYLELVEPFVLNYWGDLISFSNKTVAERLKQMLMVLESDTTLKVAFTALGLTILTDELKPIQAGIVASSDKRRKSNSKLPKMQTRKVKATVGQALSDLLDAISLAKKAHPELDYMPMVNEINVLLVSYQSEIKARSTRSKNATTTVTSSPTTLATAV